MAQLHLSNLQFGYTGAAEVLSGITLTLSGKWSGIVGANGGGKTTLLRLLTGELCPSDGSIRLDPESARVLLVPQRVEALTPEIEAFSWNWENEIARIRARLRLDPEEIDRWSTLSPGERKRWQIGAALAETPDILLLDEPTNHLDVEARDLLVEELERFTGMGLLVSHDRELLDRLTDSILRIDGGNGVLHSGNYSSAREAWLRERQSRIEQRDQLQRERKRLERRLVVARRDHEHAEKQMNRGRRITTPKDHDKRSAVAKGKIVKAEAVLGRQTGVMRRRVETSVEKLDEVRVEKEIGASVSAGYEAPKQSTLVELQLDGLYAGDKQLLEPFELSIHRGERIHLAGVNGSGKTTLMHEILRRSGLPEEKLLYLPQELTEWQSEAVLAEVLALPGETLGRVMQIVAALGVDPKPLMASELPSPGQARKLLLALGLGQRVWLAVLDEPTNHLDLPSIERIEEAIREFPGALLLVSHDRRFAEALTESSWRIEEQRLVIE